MKNTKTLVPIICVLVGLGVGFFGGYEFKNYQLKKGIGNLMTGRGNGTQNGQQMTVRGGAIFGSILSMDETSITVKLTDGSSKIIFFGESTTYTNTIDALKSDLKVGENVAVFGTANSDGSVTASTVQINPKTQINFQSLQNPSGSTNGAKPTKQTFDGPGQERNVMVFP